MDMEEVQLSVTFTYDILWQNNPNALLYKVFNTRH